MSSDALIGGWSAHWQALGVMLAIGFATWLLSVARRNVSIVDGVWSLMFLAGAAVHALRAPQLGERSLVVCALVAFWAVRLSAHITWRNWGREEDRRYRAIRARNEPGFVWKSLYLVFGLQGLLAWIISAPAAVAIARGGSVGALDLAGIALVVFGIACEALADLQLARFSAEPRNRGRVMDRGLWRYSRHPNYFGEFCVWWGFWLIAVAAGGWWTLFAPVLLSVLLLRVSGVPMLEGDIAQRRPGYREYVATTSAFFPAPPKKPGVSHV